MAKKAKATPRDRVFKFVKANNGRKIKWEKFIKATGLSSKALGIEVKALLDADTITEEEEFVYRLA